MRKFGYSEHCVYTGAMLSFIYSLFGFWEFIVWSEGFRDAFSGIPTMGVFWKIGFGEREFSADWFSGREVFGR